MTSTSCLRRVRMLHGEDVRRKGTKASGCGSALPRPDQSSALRMRSTEHRKARGRPNSPDSAIQMPCSRKRTKTTKQFSFSPNFYASCSAAQTAPPEDPPIRSPSSFIIFLAILNESLSFILTYLSIKILSKTSGKKSYPIPSTLYE